MLAQEEESLILFLFCVQFQTSSKLKKWVSGDSKSMLKLMFHFVFPQK